MHCIEDHVAPPCSDFASQTSSRNKLFADFDMRVNTINARLYVSLCARIHAVERKYIHVLLAAQNQSSLSLSMGIAMTQDVRPDYTGAFTRTNVCDLVAKKQRCYCRKAAFMVDFQMSSPGAPLRSKLLSFPAPKVGHFRSTGRSRLSTIRVHGSSSILHYLRYRGLGTPRMRAGFSAFQKHREVSGQIGRYRSDGGKSNMIHEIRQSVQLIVRFQLRTHRARTYRDWY